MDCWKNGFEMGTSGNFGNNAAVGSKDVDLRNDDVAEDFGVVTDDGGSGFVA